MPFPIYLFQAFAEWKKNRSLLFSPRHDHGEAGSQASDKRPYT